MTCLTCGIGMVLHSVSLDESVILKFYLADIAKLCCEPVPCNGHLLANDHRFDIHLQEPVSLCLPTTMSSEPISGQIGIAAMLSARCMAVSCSQRMTLSALCGTWERRPAYQHPRATATLRTLRLLCTARQNSTLSQACLHASSHLHKLHDPLLHLSSF